MLSQGLIFALTLTPRGSSCLPDCCPPPSSWLHVNRLVSLLQNTLGMTRAKYYKLHIIIRCAYTLLATGMCLQMESFEVFDKQPLNIKPLYLCKVNKNISLQTLVWLLVEGRTEALIFFSVLLVTYRKPGLSSPAL